MGQCLESLSLFQGLIHSTDAQHCSGPRQRQAACSSQSETAAQRCRAGVQSRGGIAVRQRCPRPPSGAWVHPAAALILRELLEFPKCRLPSIRAPWEVQENETVRAALASFPVDSLAFNPAPAA